MATQRARSPRDGSKIDLQSLHSRFHQVAQITLCLRISIESKEENVEPSAVCRAIVDMLDDINSDLWTFLEPAFARRTLPPRKFAPNTCNGAHDDNGAHIGNGACDRGLDDPAAISALIEEA